MKARYTVEGGIVRGWNLQSGNMDVLWITGRETVRMVNIGDNLHAIREKGLYIKR